MYQSNAPCGVVLRSGVAFERIAVAAAGGSDRQNVTGVNRRVRRFDGSETRSPLAWRSTTSAAAPSRPPWKPPGAEFVPVAFDRRTAVVEKADLPHRAQTRPAICRPCRCLRTAHR